ncbi:hypothetical protein K523DRAFT_366921 [Schizophyllum commune Tattone D]|nr:hypothetical protein K523DRAFT_366921 [Schizophyllum commune Tattone D]
MQNPHSAAYTGTISLHSRVTETARRGNISDTDRLSPARDLVAEHLGRCIVRLHPRNNIVHSVAAVLIDDARVSSALQLDEVVVVVIWRIESRRRCMSMLAFSPRRSLRYASPRAMNAILNALPGLGMSSGAIPEQQISLRPAGRCNISSSAERRPALSDDFALDLRLCYQPTHSQSTYAFAIDLRPSPPTYAFCIRPPPFAADLRLTQSTYRLRHTLTSPSSVRRKIMSSSLSKELRGKHDARRECLACRLPAFPPTPTPLPDLSGDLNVCIRLPTTLDDLNAFIADPPRRTSTDPASATLSVFASPPRVPRPRKLNISRDPGRRRGDVSTSAERRRQCPTGEGKRRRVCTTKKQAPGGLVGSVGRCRDRRGESVVGRVVRTLLSMDGLQAG